MNWFLVVYLFSTSDVLIEEKINYSQCLESIKQFKKTYKGDSDIKTVTCEQGTIIEPESI
jgi:hypothetical protein